MSDERLIRIERALDANAEQLSEMRALLERIVRLEERGHSQMESIQRLHGRVDESDKRNDRHAERLASCENRIESLTWSARLMLGAIVTGFFALIFALFRSPL